MSTQTTAPGFGETLASVSDVEGWMTDAQARRLWDAASRVRARGRIVEIGSFRGRSTIVLARAAADGVEVVAIDPHGGGDRGPQEITPDAERGDEDFRTFHANLRRAGVDAAVRHVRRMSDDALGEVQPPIDMLYVDGAHRYGPARADIERYGERVAPGGSMLVHDSYNAIGVMLAQLRLLFASSEYRYVGRSGSLAEYRRERVTGLARVRNALRQAGGIPYFVRNGFIKLAIVAKQPWLARLFGHDTGHWPY
jgi:hypothetical protein